MFTEDQLLNGKVKLKQPVDGYRVAIDPLFLASAVAASNGDHILDVGSGVGAASLCIATRLEKVKITCLEIQRSLIRLAADNIRDNNFQHRIEVLHGDLLSPPPRLVAGTYQHVISNPPYLESHSSRSPVDQGKAIAHQTNIDFNTWARFCLLMLSPKGSLTFIHRSDCLDKILGYFNGKLGGIKIYPLWSHVDKPAKRVIITGVKGSNSPLQLLPGMVLHQADGRYTPAANAVLRDGVALDVFKI